MVAVASQVLIRLLRIYISETQTKDAHFSYFYQILIRNHQVNCIVVSNSKESIKDLVSTKCSNDEVAESTKKAQQTPNQPMHKVQ